MSSRWYGVGQIQTSSFQFPPNSDAFSSVTQLPIRWGFLDFCITFYSIEWGCLVSTCDCVEILLGLKKLSDWWARRASIVHTPHSPYVIVYLLNVCPVAGDVSLTSSCLWQKPSWHFFIHFPYSLFILLVLLVLLILMGELGYRTECQKRTTIDLSILQRTFTLELSL